MAVVADSHRLRRHIRKLRRRSLLRDNPKSYLHLVKIVLTHAAAAGRAQKVVRPEPQDGSPFRRVVGHLVFPSVLAGTD